MYNILICDDEADILSALKIYLESEDYNIFLAENGVEALEIINSNDINLVLLDIMMPIMDGITTLTKIRQKSNIPVLMLTAKSEDTDKILGLNIGADDYITKPFNPVELLARVRSHLRRYMQLGGNTSSKQSEDIICIGGIELNDATKEVFVDGITVALTPTEFDILKLFMKNVGKVLSPSEIYRCVWNDSPYGAESTVAVHIRHLREKIEINAAEPRYLKVVWGQGYKITEGK